jgi:outer membrane protein TolC
MVFAFTLALRFLAVFILLFWSDNLFRLSIIIILSLASFILVGCSAPADYRQKADEVAADILKQKSQQALGKDIHLDIEKPSDTLRRKLLISQGLIRSGKASIGTDQLDKIDYWPEEFYPQKADLEDPLLLLQDDTISLSLTEALQIGAKNSFEYQTNKEAVFKEALALDLQRNEFRYIFAAQLQNLISSDGTRDRTVTGMKNSGTLSVEKKFENGMKISSAIAIDLVNLLTGSRGSSTGFSGDTSVTLPLLRGSGRHIVTEPLTQAERNVIYAMYQFERFKKTYAVDLTSSYLQVLKQIDEVKNSEDNYKSLISATKRSRRLAESGRLKEIEVDQAFQNELRARERWIRSGDNYKKSLDSFKTLLSLPPDAKMELLTTEMDNIANMAKKMLVDAEENTAEKTETEGNSEQDIELTPPDIKNVGPYEIGDTKAMQLAMDNRLDLRAIQGKVYDAQRAVVVAADALGAELTFLGRANYGDGRSITSEDLDNARFRLDRARFTTLLTLDLPIERTTERNLYRNSFINLERAVRDVQLLEDKIKITIINELRDLLRARESIYTQAKAVEVAKKRVRSVNMFLEAGRAQIRDLLEAQESLLSAQNALTSAAVDYRITELNLQRDMGLIQADENGLVTEFNPQGI